MEGETPTTPTADAVTEAPAPQDQPVETTAPEAVTPEVEPTNPETPEVEAESFSKFNLNEVPEEYREHVEKAYKQLQGDYTRKTQEAAEFRKNAESAMSLAEAIQTPDGLIGVMGDEYAEAAFAKLAERLGYQLEGDEGAAEPDLTEMTPEEALAHRIDQLEEQLQSREAAEQQAAAEQAEQQRMKAFDESIDAQFAAINETLDEPLSDGFEDTVLSKALTMPADEHGNPPIREAYDAIRAEIDAEFKRREAAWVASKDAPHVASGGASASQVPDLDDHDQRVKAMVDRLTGGVTT